MDKFVPYEKQSKKQKKAADRAKRTVWTMNPITRRPENPKAYNRKKTLYRDDDLSKVFSFLQRCLFLTDSVPKISNI